MKKAASTNEISSNMIHSQFKKELIFKWYLVGEIRHKYLIFKEKMRYYLIIALTILVNIGYGQNQGQQIDCGMKEEYKKSTFKRYGRFKTFNFSSAYYNSEGRLCYIGTPRKKVTGYYGKRDELDYFKRGRSAGRIKYYDPCATRVKEVHLFYPKRKDGKTTHLKFYENGKKKEKTIDRNNKATKIITWDAKGKKTTKRIPKTERYY